MSSRFLELAMAFKGARALQVAVRLGIFDTLATKPAGAPALARVLGADARSLRALLATLRSLGLLSSRSGKFALTVAARRHLVSGSPRSLTSMIRWQAGGYLAFTALEECVRTGATVSARTVFRGEEDWRRLWIDAMHELSQHDGQARRLAGAVDAAGARRLLDVGGGSGAYSSAFCEAYSGLRAEIYETPEVAPLTRSYLSRLPAGDRVLVHARSFGEAEPIAESFELALASNLLHCLTERENRRLLRKIFLALKPGGRLIVHGPHLVGSDDGPLDAVLLSLTMTLFSARRNFSVREIGGWLRQTGFRSVVSKRLSTRRAPELLIARKPH